MKVVATVRPRTRRECSLCFITHLPTACPGERVGVVAPARECSGCFLTHLPAKCPEVVRRRMETVDALASAFREADEAKKARFLSSGGFRPPYRQTSKPVGYVSHSRQQLGLSPREREKQTNAQLFGTALHSQLEQELVKKKPTMQPKEPLSLTATMVGRKGERKTLQVRPGMLSRFAEVLMTDASCGVATRVHQVFVGASPQIVPAFVRETTASLMARIEAGFMIFRHQGEKRMLDTCQKELFVSFDVEFLEDASFSVRLVGECCRGC